MKLSTRFAAVACACALLALGACLPSKAPIAKLATTPAKLTLAWPASTAIEIALTPTAPLPTGVETPIVFVHLLDEPGSVVRTFDHELRGTWREGREIRYEQRIFQSALAAPLPAGTYLLSIGLHDPRLGRFALATSGEEIAKQEYQIAAVEVPPTSAAGPEARFSGEWLPPEPAKDRQVVASRPLRGGLGESGGALRGTIGFGPLAGPGTIHLGLQAPGVGGAGARLEIADGGGQPKVKVSSSCGAQQSEVSGTGRFELELAVPAGGPPTSCEIVVEPNFFVKRGDRGDNISVRLDELSYGAATGDDGRAP